MDTVADVIPPSADQESPEDELEDCIKRELDEKWILNLSTRFEDRLAREKFFAITYVEPPKLWRRVTVSGDSNKTPPDSLEQELEALHHERDKSEKIYRTIRNSLEQGLEAMHHDRDESEKVYSTIRNSLQEIDSYDTTTSLLLKNAHDGRLHVHKSEDTEKMSEGSSEDSISAMLDTESTNIGGWEDREKGCQISRGLPSANSRNRRTKQSSYDHLDRSIVSISAAASTGSMALTKPKPSAERVKAETQKPSFFFRIDHIASRGVNDSADTVLKIKRGLSGFVNKDTKVMSAMADTGSTENVISAAYANELKLEIQGSPCLFKLGNSKKTRSLGTLTLSYDINSRQDTS